MKQFTDFHSTPLKFHKFFHYIWTPVIFASSLFVLIGQLADKTYNPYTGAQLAYGILNCGLIAAYFIGFFRWKLYSWYCLFVQMAAEIIFSVGTYILYITIVPLNSFTEDLAFGNIIGVAVRSTLIGIYYYKRKPLFSEKGFNPRSKAVLSTKPAAENSAADVPSAEDKGIFCTACGVKNSSRNSFCTACGAAIPQKYFAPTDVISAETATVQQSVKESRTAFADTAVPAYTSVLNTAETAPADTTASDTTTAVFNSDTAQSAGRTVKTVPESRKSRVVTAVAAVAIVALGALNIFQYSQLNRYKAETAALYAQLDTVQQTIAGYNQRISELNSTVSSYSYKAGLYDDIAEFVSEKMPRYSSSTYYPSQYLLFIPENSDGDFFKLFANLDNVTVSFYTSGRSVNVDYAEDWSGNSIDIMLTPNRKGLTTIHFSNDINSETFDVLVFVV